MVLISEQLRDTIEPIRREVPNKQADRVLAELKSKWTRSER
jgi:hypothetical protein